MKMIWATKKASATGAMAAALVMAIGVGARASSPAKSSLIKASAVWQAPLNNEHDKPYFVAYEAAHQALWTANFGNATVSVRSAENGRLLHTLHTGWHPLCVAIDEANQRAFIVNSGDGTVSCFNTATYALIKNFTVGKRPQIGTLDAEKGSLWVANYDDGTVSIIWPDSGSIQTLRAGKGACGVAIDSQRRRVYVANSVAASLKVFDADTLRVVNEIPLAATPTVVAVDAISGAVFVTHSDTGCLSYLADPENGTAASIPMNGSPLGLAIDAQRGRVYVADSKNQNLRVLDVQGLALETCEVGKSPLGVTFDPASGQIWVSGADNNTIDTFEMADTQRPAIRLAALPHLTTVPNLPVTAPNVAGAKLPGQVKSEPALQVEQPEQPIQSKQPVQMKQPEQPGQAPVPPGASESGITAFPPALQVVPINNDPSSSDAIVNELNDLPPAPGTPVIPTTPVTPVTLVTPVTPGSQRRFYPTAPSRPKPQVVPQILDSVPPGMLGQRIAQEAQKLQDSGASFSYVGQCDRLADTAILNATSRFSGIVGPRSGDTAANTMRRFQLAGMGFPFSSSTRLRPGDLLYAGSNVGRGCGHAMIVGPRGLILDQYGANASPKVRPQWVIRPDAPFAAHTRVQIAKIQPAPHPAPGAKLPIFPIFPVSPFGATKLGVAAFK